MMYTERDRPFLLRRPLQTSLNTTFSPAFRGRDYPLRIFNHTLWGGFDCLFRVREVKEGSLEALAVGAPSACSRPRCVYKQGLEGWEAGMLPWPMAGLGTALTALVL